MTGCYAQLKPEEVSHIEGVDLVLGAEQKLDILMYLDDLKKKEEGGAVIASQTKRYPYLLPLLPRRTTVRAIS